MRLIPLVAILAISGGVLTTSADSARAQFLRGAATPSTALPQNVQTGLGQLPSNVSSQQLQQMMLLRYLQSRSGRSGGVQRGAPQFVPFGNGFMPNQAMQNQQNQLMPAAQVAAPADQGVSTKKTKAEKRAEYEAAREERKQKARERAEARKAEAAERRAAADAAAADPS